MYNGMSKNGFPPMNVNSWRQLFTKYTIGNKKNSVVMGRMTYESIVKSENRRSLEFRENHVISNKLIQDENCDIIIEKSLVECLCGIANRGCVNNDEVWLIGGEKVFCEAVKKLLCYCDKIIICKMTTQSFDCDQFFPMARLKEKNLISKIEQKTNEYELHVFEPGKTFIHQEKAYLDVLKNIVEEGFKITDDVDTASYSRVKENVKLEFDLREEFPIITSRFIDFKQIIRILCEDFSNCDFDSDSIGFRLRSNKMFSKPGSYEDENDFHSDQLNGFIEDLMKNDWISFFLERQSIRLLNDKNSIPSEIIFRKSKKHLHCTVFCKKMEMFKYFPHYLTYISLLMKVTSLILDVIPTKLTFFINNACVRDIFFDFSLRLAKCDPKPLPQCVLKNVQSLKSIFDISVDMFDLVGYQSWTKLDIQRIEKR